MGWLVLAAGQSRRFNGAKLLARLPNGSSVLETVITHLQQTPYPILVMVRPEDWELQTQLKSLNCDFVPCATAHLGMGHTLAYAVQQVANIWPWAGIVLADMPFIKPATFNSLGQLAHNLKTNQHKILAPVFARSDHQTKRGHPVIFGADLFATLQTLTGDAGARALLREYAHEVDEFHTTDIGVTEDIDTQDDLKNSLARNT